MAIDLSVASATISTGPSADRSTIDYQCHFVCCAIGLPMENASEVLSELEHRLRSILEMGK
jgi:hypothetical protein